MKIVRFSHRRNKEGVFSLEERGCFKWNLPYGRGEVSGGCRAACAFAGGRGRRTAGTGCGGMGKYGRQGCGGMGDSGCGAAGDKGDVGTQIQQCNYNGAENGHLTSANTIAPICLQCAANLTPFFRNEGTTKVRRR